MDQRWDDVETLDVDALVRGLQAHIDGDGPIYPKDDRRSLALHLFLYRQKPDPRGFLPLFGPHAETDDVDDRLLKRDIIAYSVLTSFLRRLWVNPKDQHRAHLYDVIAAAGVHFAFDRAYGESHTATGVEVSDFFTEPQWPVCAESTAALRKVLDDLIAQWRQRVTDKASSTFFGMVLRHLGAEGGEKLFAEWEQMNEDERYDLLKRAADEEQLGKGARTRMAEALLDPSLEVRQAAVEALEEHGAPLGDLDASSRDEDVERALPKLRRWAAETKS